jgi:hypothetical protein
MLMVRLGEAGWARLGRLGEAGGGWGYNGRSNWWS